MSQLRGINRSTAVTLAAGLMLVCCSRAVQSGEISLRSPGLPASKVADDGSLIEPWGKVQLLLLEPQGAKIIEHRAAYMPMPAALRKLRAGSVLMSQTAYRAPIWPSGVDVLEVLLTNEGKQAVKAVLKLSVPESVEFGESAGSLGGRPVVALPPGLEPVRPQRDWGCLGGVVAMPGWAKPKGKCDPAFRNIAAGMGGVPITYRFTLPKGARRKIVLGFCESFHPSAGVRPLMLIVEGAPKQSLDPIGRWGRHAPGVVQFNAKDANGDGCIELTVAPHPHASDRNPILNVIWLFEPDARIDEPSLIAGRLNEVAERYVDVGGSNDQMLYKPGPVKFVLELEPGAQRELLFLLASPGCRLVPDLTRSAWTKPTLRKAATEVWRDRWSER